MLFSKPKPTVTPEDKEWIEEAFVWFEQQYGSEYLKKLSIIEPTRAFFDRDFDGTEADADFLLERICELMEIKGVNINLYFFSEAPIEFTDESTEAKLDESESGYALGKYSEADNNTFEIGIETSQLRDVESMVATIAHELSHLILLGEGRLHENDEPLTDLNCIALGFGIYTGNSIFRFQQWHGTSHQGWSASGHGYIPEQVAAYAMALLQQYQKNSQDWSQYLNKSLGKMYKRNLKYLQTTSDKIDFLAAS